MKEYTDITVLLDRSGSMEKIKDAMEEAYNGFISKHKENKSTRITLIQFDNVNPQQVVYQDVPVADAKPLTLNPRGSTPLLDALCNAIDNTGERLADMKEEDRPDQVLFVIITDGQENASKTFKRSDVKARVRKQNDAYKWQFVYLGANQDAFAEASSYGISHKHTINWTGDHIHTANLLADLATNTVGYANLTKGERGGAVGAAAALDFTEEQRKRAIDNPSKKGTK